jgi:hypothetical protein
MYISPYVPVNSYANQIDYTIDFKSQIIYNTAKISLTIDRKSFPPLWGKNRLGAVLSSSGISDTHNIFPFYRRVHKYRHRQLNYPLNYRILS